MARLPLWPRLVNGDSPMHAVASSTALDEYLARACDASMPPRILGPAGKRPVHWWSDEIAELRKSVLCCRRSYQRTLRRHGPQDSEASRIQFLAARKRLRAAIRIAKDRCWKELCDEVESDPWGKPYRIVMNKFGSVAARKASAGKEIVIADHLFPAAPVTDWDLAPPAYAVNLFDAFDPDSDEMSYVMNTPLFELAELRKACARLSAGKAGGPSGIPNEVLKQLIMMRPLTVLQVYNNCLKALHFPRQWKQAKLVLLHKGIGKPIESPSSFRPICLLNTPGKLLERLILQRLEEHLDARGGARRSPNQFGFRKGISTESAIESVLSVARRAAASSSRRRELCVLVTLDVRNAFNSLGWPVIDKALRMKGTPEYLVRFLRSWLSERSLLVGEDRTERPVTCGVPQGSVLGPTLWNVAYDSLLSLAVPSGVQLVGFADDLAVVGRAASAMLLEQRVNKVLTDIDNWMSSHGLELAHQKSEALMLTKRLAYTPPRLTIGGHAIAIKQDIRYLGVRLDTRMTFVSHVRNAADKAIKSATALSRLMPNLGGSGQWRRRLLASVVESQLLYAAPVWGDRVRASARTVALLVRAQRLIALRVIRAYKTVSDEAALLLAGMPPVDLLALERGRLRKRFGTAPLPGEAPISKGSLRRSERSITLDLWQRRWLFSKKGLWTKRLIPDVRRWADRRLPRVPLTYRITQFLTGHGCFQYYLNRMGRAASPLCVQCGNAMDSVEHTIIECPYWETYRTELVDRLGARISVAALSRIMCGPAEEDLPDVPEQRETAISEATEDLRLLYRLVENLLSAKEEEERIGGEPAIRQGRRGACPAGSCSSTMSVVFARLLKQTCYPPRKKRSVSGMELQLNNDCSLRPAADAVNTFIFHQIGGESVIRQGRRGACPAGSCSSTMNAVFARPLKQ
ncbi:Uncharacterized protein FWK35_00017152 [Aphis craccivora]|uniref:Reverse transcriptase domain-containing protein n=1 Tax=Aphis craccivora TaxID=307492 RepID=A0A6G0YKQ6_APHCR|nr:Uncharacterized protein FWK35_00017152 [Aphis craccivora]